MMSLSIKMLLLAGLCSATFLSAQSYCQQYDNYDSNSQGWYGYRNNNTRANQENTRANQENTRANHEPVGTDWDYEESWRNNPKAYFSGKTQPQAYREAHPYGQGGIGYDGDPEYVGMENAYKQTHPNWKTAQRQQQQQQQRELYSNRN